MSTFTKKLGMKKSPSLSLNFDRPLTTVDVVVFTAKENALHVLLVKRPSGRQEPFPERWALPGGFVDTAVDASLEACAMRKLKEKTGVDAPYLEQLGSWGDAERDPRGWSTTHVYFTLLPLDSIQLDQGSQTREAQWFSISGEGIDFELAFDHGLILEAAVQRLRNKAEYTSLPAYLLPAEFTLPQLQSAYEVVLGRPMDKSAFRTRVLSAGLVEALEGRSTGAYRPAQLYKLQSPGDLTYFPRTFSPKR